jgi:hypothetical protein
MAFSENSVLLHSVFSKGFSGRGLYGLPINKDYKLPESPNINIITSPSLDLANKAYQSKVLNYSTTFARFIPFVGESVENGSVNKATKVQDSTQRDYVEKCMNIAMRDKGSRDVLRFGRKAHEYFFDFSMHCENQYIDYRGKSRKLHAIIKHDYVVSRISAILHVLNNCDDCYWKMQIKESSVENAVKIFEQFVLPNVYRFRGLTY